MSGRDITSIFMYIVTLIWLSAGVGLDILMLVLNAEREITTEREIRLLNSIIAGRPLYLTSTGIDEERD